MMNTLDRRQMYKETRLDNEINDKGTINNNAIFDK